MRFNDLWATLRRRWYFVLVAVALGTGASVLAVDLVGPTYAAEGAVLLIPPGTTVQRQSNDSTGALGNPLLSLGGLSQARDITIQTLSAKTTYEELCQQTGDPAFTEMQAELCASRPGVTYEVTPDFTSSAPVINITVKGNTAANSVTGLRVLMERVPTTLSDLQSGLVLRQRAEISSLPLVMDTNPDVVYKSQIRAAIAVGAGVLGLGLLLIGLLDGAVQARRRAARDTSALAVGDADDTVSVAGDFDEWGWDRARGDDPDLPGPKTTSAVSAPAGVGEIDATSVRK